MSINWAFQINDDGSSQGWNDPSIAEFKSNRLESLTREIIQNSLDAAMSEDSEVVVEFKRLQIKSENIPNIEDLRQVVRLCEKQKDYQNSDLIKEFEIAKKVIGESVLSILRISDSNTTGMPGPCIPGKPFYQYLKTVGQSGGSINRGGSHGIGKAAPLACSDLRTIFVSTVWKEGLQTRDLVQGRAVLMSFEKDGRIHKSTGYWGDTATYSPVEAIKLEAKNSWIHRDQVGTTINVLGFSYNDGEWENAVCGYAVSNFFGAFHRKKLRLVVNDREIDSTNYRELFNNIEVVAAIKRLKSGDKFEESYYYSKCLWDTETTKLIIEVNGLGKVSVNLLLDENSPRRIALIRNNMLITDQIPGFWTKVPGRISDFGAVIEVLDTKGSKLIRQMEPPSHNSLSSDWLPTKEEKKRGKEILDRLAEQLKGIVEEHAGGTNENFGKIEFMAEFFSDTDGSQEGGLEFEEIDPNSSYTVRMKPIKLKNYSQSTTIEEVEGEEDSQEEGQGLLGGGMHGGSGKPIRPGGSSPGTTPGTDDSSSGGGGKQNYTYSKLELINCRIVLRTPQKATVYFNVSKSSKISMRMLEVGSDYDEPVSIVQSQMGAVKNGELFLDVTGLQREVIELTLDRQIVGGVKIVATEHKV